MDRNIFWFMTLYTLISWVPSIGTDSGMPFKLATYMGTMLNIGAFVGSTGSDGWRQGSTSGS